MNLQKLASITKDLNMLKKQSQDRFKSMTALCKKLLRKCEKLILDGNDQKTVNALFDDVEKVLSELLSQIYSNEQSSKGTGDNNH